MVLVVRPILNGLNKTYIRSLTYLHSGERVRGLKKDPESYLKNPTGLQYSKLETNTYHKKIRKILNLEKYNISISDENLLQCFTHKSFAHASKPYNEKLALMGAQFLKYQTSVFSVSEPNMLSKVSEGKSQKNINEFNFTNLGTQFSKLLIAKKSISSVLVEKKLADYVFWKKRNPLKENHWFNGEETIYSTVVTALIGSILIANGPQKAAAYIDGELLNRNNEISLINSANKQLLQSSQSLSSAGGAENVTARQ